MATEAERQAEALQRLLDMLESLYNVLSDQELLRAVMKLVITPELLMVIDRLPQITSLLEKVTRPEVLSTISALLELASKVNVKALAAAAEAMSRAPEATPSLSQLVAQLGDPAVLRGLSTLISIARAIGSS